jgi:hypothetical protein
MKKINKIILTLLVAGGLTGAARAEFGVSAGASFNYKADFQSAAAAQPRATDPGAAVAGTDHFYDDGYNRVDSSDNAGGETSYWGYQNASQDNGGSITMNSAQTTINQGSSSETQEDAQPALEVYWQQDITSNKQWNVGFRTALRWQRIELDNRAVYGTTIETISDTYSYTGIPPGAPFDGSFGGPNFLLSDSPVRSITSAAGPTVTATRNLDADLFGFDLGPTLALNLTKKLRAVLSTGGTVAWMRSDFSYRDGALASGSDTKEEFLFGAYAGADLQYRIGEHWGIFGGAAYNWLQNFDQQVDGRSAELQFGDSCTLRTGLFFQ